MSTPIIYVQNLTNVSAVQQTGWFKLTSRTPTDGIYTVNIVFPQSVQPGLRTIFSTSLADSTGNGYIWSVHPTSQTNLVVINNRPSDFEDPVKVPDAFCIR